MQSQITENTVLYLRGPGKKRSLKCFFSPRDFWPIIALLAKVRQFRKNPTISSRTRNNLLNGDWLMPHCPGMYRLF